MKLKKVIKAANSMISDGSEYCWKCYGPNARFLDFSNNSGKEVANCIFDSVTKYVYQIEVYGDGNHPSIWFDYDFIEAHDAEARERNVEPLTAWDDVMYIQVINKETILEHLHDAVTGIDIKVEKHWSDSPWPFQNRMPEEDEEFMEDLYDECDSNCNSASCGSPNETADEGYWDAVTKQYGENTVSKKEYKVTLNVKSVYSVQAETVEEATEIAETWYLSNRSSTPLPKSLCWEDQYVSHVDVGIDRA